MRMFPPVRPTACAVRVAVVLSLTFALTACERANPQPTNSNGSTNTNNTNGSSSSTSFNGNVDPAKISLGGYAYRSGLCLVYCKYDLPGDPTSGASYYVTISTNNIATKPITKPISARTLEKIELPESFFGGAAELQINISYAPNSTARPATLYAEKDIILVPPTSSELSGAAHFTVDKESPTQANGPGRTFTTPIGFTLLLNPTTVFTPLPTR